MSGSARGPQRVRFAPAPLASRSAVPPIETLRAMREESLSAFLAQSSRANYATALNHWSAFAATLGFPFEPSEESLGLFITWRWSVSTSVAATLSGLAFHFRPLMSGSRPTWDAVRDSPHVNQCLVGGAKKTAHRVKKAAPLQFADVDRLTRAALADTSTTYARLLWTAQLVVLFFCCGRAAEVTMPDVAAYRDPRKWMPRALASVSPAAFHAFLPYHKADPTFVGSSYDLADVYAGAHFTRLLDRYVRTRDILFGPAGPLFCLDGDPPTRLWFVTHLKALVGPQYTGHSGRTGGATWFILQGWSTAAVQRQGRWKSAAWEDYVRITPEVGLALGVAEARRLLAVRARHS